MKRQLLMLAIPALLISCSDKVKNEEDLLSLNREEMPEAVLLTNPQVIEIPEMLNPAYFNVVNDSLLFVTNQQNMENFVDVYSLHSASLLFHLAHHGEGPKEMLSCMVNSHSSVNDFIFLMDSSKKRYYKESIDEILKSGSFALDHYFSYSSEVHENFDIIDVSDSTYLAYNMWYLNSEEYQNGIVNGVQLFHKNTDSGKGLQDFQNFVASVNGARVFEIPDESTFWTADTHRDEILVLNSDLSVKKRIVGPDNFRVSYNSAESDAPISFVTFSDEKDYRTYTDYFVTQEHVYLIYEGNDNFNMEELRPVEMFKFDHAGNLLATYKFDRFINSISITKDENYLYCGSRESISEIPMLLRYKLK